MIDTETRVSVLESKITWLTDTFRELMKHKKITQEIQEKTDELTFAEALKLLQDGKAKKISCWTLNIWVMLDYITLEHYEENQPDIDHKAPYLLCKTCLNHLVIWKPNMYEMLEAKWRVVE